MTHNFTSSRQRRRVFVAGPFRAKTPWQRAANVANAQRMSLELAKLGAAPYCPHLNVGHAFGHIDEADAEVINLSFLEICDAVVLLPGWEVSDGSCIERMWAKRLGKTIFEIRPEADDALGEIKTWILAGMQPIGATL